MFNRPFIAVAFAIASPLVCASDADLTILIEKNTSVSGTQTSIPVKYTITRQMIAEGAFSDLSDVLRSVPSLTFTNDTLGNGTTGVIDLRGFGETAHSSTLVLVDGIALNNPTNEAPNLNLIPLAMIEKIEILVGGAGAAAGNEAVGGVVSISTVPGSVSNFTQIHASGGQFGSVGTGISGALLLDEHSGLAYSAEVMDQTGYRDFSDFKRNSANLNWSRSHNGMELSVNFLRSDEDRNGSGAISQATLNSNRKDVGTRSVADITQQQLSGSMSVIIDSETEYRLDLSSRKGTQYVLYDYTSGTPFDAEEQVDQETVINAATLRRKDSSKTHSVEVGLKAQYSDYLNTREYYGYSPSTKDQLRKEQSVFLEYAQAITAQSSLSLGYRHLNAKDELSPISITNRSLNALSSSLTRAVGSVDYFARVDRGFRLPTLDENNATYTDQKLLHQTHTSLEVGGSSESKGLSGFFMSTENEIRPTIRYYSGGNYYSATNANIKKTERLGLQAYQVFSISPQTTMNTSYSFTQAKSVEGLDAGKHIPGVPTHVASVVLKNRHSNYITSILDFRYQSATYALNDHQNLYGRHGEYAIADFALTYTRSGFRGGLRINNLFDNRYNLYHIVSPTPTTASASGPSVTPAEPINLQVHVEYVF